MPGGGALLRVASGPGAALVVDSSTLSTASTGVVSIGSGGPFATAAGTALLRHTKLSARRIAEEAMQIAGKICIYTNDKITFEELE